MIAPSTEQLFVLVQSFIMSLLPLDIDHVIRGLDDDVPMPIGDFVLMSEGKIERLSTNIDYNDSATQVRSVMMPTEYSMQIDCYGPNSGDYATILTAMWRDQYGCDALAPDAAPLYSTSPIQMPLTNAEKNYEKRFTLTLLLQFNPVVSAQQQSANALKANLIDVDVVFPPA